MRLNLSCTSLRNYRPLRLYLSWYYMRVCITNINLCVSNIHTYIHQWLMVFKCWWCIDGDLKNCKGDDEAIDDVNNSITFKIIKEDLVEDYKSFKLTIKCSPKDEKTSIIHWTSEYEKHHDDFGWLCRSNVKMSLTSQDFGQSGSFSQSEFC